MNARHIRDVVLATFLLLGLTFVPAQNEESDGGLRVGSGSGGSAAPGAVVEELRAIHARLGELLAQLDGTEGGGGDLAELESRVARLETQVRQASAREAQRRLETLRSELERGADPADVAAGVGDVRAGLERAYVEAGDRDIDEQAFGRELRTRFDALVGMLEAGEDPRQAFADVQGELMSLGTGEASAAGDGEDGATEEAAAEEQGAGADEADADPQVLGPQTYATHCVACHQGNGEGVEGAFPALAGNPFVTGDPAPVIDVVLNGRGGMPAFSGLSNEEIAAVISHERTSWGNDAEPITPEMVAIVREGGDLEGLEAPEDGPNVRPGAAD